MVSSDLGEMTNGLLDRIENVISNQTCSARDLSFNGSRVRSPNESLLALSRGKPNRNLLGYIHDADSFSLLL